MSGIVLLISSQSLTAIAPSPVTVISGDGIGPEVIAAVVRLVDAAGDRIAWEHADAGAEVFRAGVLSGVPGDPLPLLHEHALLSWGR